MCGDAVKPSCNEGAGPAHKAPTVEHRPSLPSHTDGPAPAASTESNCAVTQRCLDAESRVTCGRSSHVLQVTWSRVVVTCCGYSVIWNEQNHVYK